MISRWVDNPTDQDGLLFKRQRNVLTKKFYWASLLLAVKGSSCKRVFFCLIVSPDLLHNCSQNIQLVIKRKKWSVISWFVVSIDHLIWTALECMFFNHVKLALTAQPFRNILHIVNFTAEHYSELNALNNYHLLFLPFWSKKRGRRVRDDLTLRI